MTAVSLSRDNHFVKSNFASGDVSSGQYPLVQSNESQIIAKAEKHMLDPINVIHQNINSSMTSLGSSPSTASTRSKLSFVEKYVSPAKKIFHNREGNNSTSKNLGKSNSMKSEASNSGFSDSCTCELTKYGRLNGTILGRGAWGIVKTIERRSDGKLFAVKKFRNRESNESPRHYVKTILAEYTIASLLHHPYIIETLDFIVQDGRYHQIMEHCPTDLFSALVSRKHTINSSKVDTWFKQIVSAVAYMHQIGVVHRDIKGENILLDSEDKVKVIDFGLADVYKTAFESTPRPSKGKSGSSPYIAPEVHINSKSYDGRKVDSWSLGILFITMHLGVFPWECATSADQNYSGYISRRNCLDRAILNKLTPAKSSLIHRLLDPNPELRMSVEEALEHETLKDIIV